MFNTYVTKSKLCLIMGICCIEKNAHHDIDSLEEICQLFFTSYLTFDHFITLKTCKKIFKMFFFCRFFSLFQPGTVCMLYLTATICIIRYPKEGRGIITCLKQSLQNDMCYPLTGM